MGTWARRAIGTLLAGTLLALVSVLVGAAVLWDSWTGSCHTWFLLSRPIEAEAVADGIRNSGAQPHEYWHEGPGERRGGILAGSLMIDDVVDRYLPGHQIVAFRLKGIVDVESLGPLASSVVGQRIVHATAVLTSPDLNADPPVHVVKSFGTC